MKPKKEEKRKLLENKLTDAKIQERYSKISDLPIRELNDLDDVNITNPQNGEVLTYNSTSEKWENA